MTCEISSERDGTNLVLTLSDAPTRNALTPQACAAAIEVLDSAESDAEVRCIVVRGAGEHFCAGMSGAHDRLEGLIASMRAIDKPVIAAVEGDALGAGCAVVLGCDLVVASAQARFGLDNVAWPPTGLPRALALQLTWLSDPMSAQQWQAYGLVTQVAERGQALSDALALGEQLAKQPPSVLAGAKKRINEA